MDESLFRRKIKYQSLRRLWIFSLVERQTNRIKLFAVENCDAQKLLKIITENVEQGSKLHSNGWAAYKNLAESGYQHYVVEHNYAYQAIYKRATTRESITIHTTCIEGAWKLAKVNQSISIKEYFSQIRIFFMCH